MHPIRLTSVTFAFTMAATAAGCKSADKPAGSATLAVASSHCVQDTCHYMTIYATQITRKPHQALDPDYHPALTDANYSHSFASFVSVRGGAVAEQVDINWMPEWAHQKGWVNAGLTDSSEPGVNWPVARTLTAIDDWNAANPGRLRTIDSWGPYPVDPRLFEAAKGFKATLDAGKYIKYKAVDRGSRLETPGKRAINCFHAISDLDVGIRRRVLDLPDPENTGYRLRTYSDHGIRASRQVAIYMRGYVVGGNYAYEGTSAPAIARLLGHDALGTPVRNRSSELLTMRVADIETFATLPGGDTGGGDPGESLVPGTALGSLAIRTGLLRTGKGGLAFAGGPKSIGKLRVETPLTCGVFKLAVDGIQRLDAQGRAVGQLLRPAVVQELPGAGRFTYDFKGHQLAGVYLTISGEKNHHCQDIRIAME